MIAFRHWAKAWTGALVSLLAVVFVGSSFHVHYAEHSRAQEVVALLVVDNVVVSADNEDGSADRGDKHDKWACQECTVAAQVMAPPILMLLTTAVPAGVMYRQIDVERAGLDPPGMDRPPMLSLA